MLRNPHRLLTLFLAFVVSAATALGGIPTTAIEYALGEPDSVAPSSEQEPVDGGETPDEIGDVQNVEDDPSALDDQSDTPEPADAGDGSEQPDEQIVPAAPTGEDEAVQGSTDENAADSQKEAPSTPEDEVGIEDATQQEKDPDAESTEAEAVEAEAQTPRVAVLTHVQKIGWAKSWVTNGGIAGTQGRSLRMEAIRLRLEQQGTQGGGIRYRAHVQNEGWQNWVTGDAVSGSTGKSRRVEALQVELQGELAERYDVWYRVHCQNYGWMAWAKNGETAGTAGKSLRLEAIQVVVTESGAAAPDAPNQATNRAFIGAEEVSVSAHVQNKGWMKAVGNGKVAGTTGKSLRVEALRASLSGARVPGGVQTTVHVQNKGWMKPAGNGKVAGTTGKSLRVEALKMSLTGEAADVYDLYYRAHVQGVGWLSWASEGEVAGSEGLSLRVEAIQTRLVAQGAAAPSSADAAYPNPAIGTMGVTYAAHVQGAWQAAVSNGATAGTTGRSLPLTGLTVSLTGSEVNLGAGVSYRAYLQDVGWADWVANGDVAGLPAQGKRVEAIQVKLTGKSAAYNVWYRVHAEGFGWMGWTSNGRSAGSSGMSRRIEAVQIKIVPVSKGAPGSTYRPYFDGGLRTGLSAAKGSRSVTTFGGFNASSKVIRDLTNAVNGIRNRGYDVGFIMMDLETHKGVAYNCDGRFYGASSIKAPYIASVVSKHPDAVSRYAYDITETLFYSWDYNYKNVLAAYGKGPMRTFCSDAGVRGAIAEQLPWADYSARELAKMWARTYQVFLESSAGEQFGKWLERPNVSTIHTTLGGKYRTRSKAGWIDDGYEVVPGINGGGPRYRVSDDGGIVYAKNGAYVVAIMSAVPADHNMLSGLTSAIDAAHRAM